MDRADGGGQRKPILAASAALFSFSLLAAAVALVALVLVLGLSRNHSELQEHNVPYAVAVSTASLDAKAIANHERGYLISGRREFLDEIDQNLLAARRAFSEAQFAAKDDEQLLAAAKAERGFEHWVAMLKQEQRTFQQGDRKQATAIALGRSRALRKQYEASLAEARRVAFSAIELQRNSLASSGWIFILLAALIVVLAGGFGLAVVLVPTLRRTDALAAPAPTGRPVSLLPPARERRG